MKIFCITKKVNYSNCDILDKKVINNIDRIEFINEIFIPLIEEFEKETNLDVKISGMPYIRTMNAQNIMDEIGKFVVIAIIVTIFIFFSFLDLTEQH